MANQFLVSVANALLKDPNSGNALAYGIANLNSTFTMTLQKTEVRGGISNPLLYTYLHDKALEVKIEEATFSSAILALNSGTSVLSGNVSVVGTDCIVLSGGSGTVTNTPTGNVNVFLPNGTIQTVSPSTKTITVSGGGDQRVTAVYNYLTTADQVIIETTKPPSVVDLTLIAEVRDNTGVIVYYWQCNVPRFQVSGNFTLNLTANGVSTQAIDGNALAVATTDCASGEYYAKVTWVPAAATSVAYSSIAAAPDPITFSVGGGLPASRQLTVLGIRGGLYANTVLTTSASYVRTSGSPSFSVSAGGLITAGATTLAGGSALFTASYYDSTSGSLTDTVFVSATA